MRKKKIITEGLNTLTETQFQKSFERSERNADLINRYYENAPVKNRRALIFRVSAIAAAIVLIIAASICVICNTNKNNDVYLDNDCKRINLSSEQLSAEITEINFSENIADYTLSANGLYYEGKTNETIYLFLSYENTDGKIIEVFYLKKLEYKSFMPNTGLLDLSDQLKEINGFEFNYLMLDDKTIGYFHTDNCYVSVFDYSADNNADNIFDFVNKLTE